MANSKISNLDNNITVEDTDLVVIVDDVLGTPVTEKRTVGELLESTVRKTGDQTVAGVKTFSSSPVIPAPTTDLQAATKKYVDDSKVINVTVTTARTTAAKVGTTSGGSYTPVTGDRINVTFTLGCAVATPTLNIDGSGAKNIRLGGVNVSTTLLSTPAASVTVPMFYDGTYFELYGSQLNTDTNTTYIEAISGIAVTGTTQTCAVNTLYYANNATSVAFNLPATCALNQVVEIVGLHATGAWTLTAPAGDNISIAGNDTGAAGVLTGTARSTVKLRCVVANTTWVVTDHTGVISSNTGYTTALPSGSGDVVGPATSTDNSIPRFDGITGKLLQTNSSTYIDDSGKMGVGTASPGARLDIIAEASASLEVILHGSVSDVAGDAYGFALANLVTNDGRISPGFIGKGNHSGYSGLNFYGQGSADNSNGIPLINFDASIGSSNALSNVAARTAVALRPLFNFDNAGTSVAIISAEGNLGIGTLLPDTKLHVAGAVTQQPLSSDPADPDAGNSVQWVSDGTGSGGAGDVMMKINVGGTVKTLTLVDFSALT